MSYLIYVNGLGPNYKGDNLYEFIFSDNLDVFKKHIRKFSGEFHFSNVAYGVVSRQVSMNILINLKNDKDLDFRLFSLDGVDITEYFWINPNHYTEIIISGYVKQ